MQWLNNGDKEKKMEIYYVILFIIFIFGLKCKISFFISLKTDEDFNQLLMGFGEGNMERCFRNVY